MNKLDQVREQYPQYNDWSDEELAFGLYKKFYSDKPLVGYAKEIGFDKSQSLKFLKHAAEQGKTVSFGEGEPKPSVGGDVGGMGRGLFQGITFGGGDEIVAGGAALGRKLLQGDERDIGDIYQQELGRERARLGEYRETDPWKAYGSEFAGGAAVPLGTASTFKSAVGTGAALGGVGAFASSEGDISDRLMAMPVGVGLGVILGGATQTVGKTLQETVKSYLSRKAQEALTKGAASVDDLKAQATEAYKKAYQGGVQITPQAFENLVSETLDQVTGGRPLRAALTPKGADVMQAMQDELQSIMKSNGFVGIEDLSYFRQLANVPAKDFNNPAEQRIAGIIQTNIDKFMDSLTPAQLRAGDASKVVKELKKATGTWSRMRKTERVEKLLQDAYTYAGGLESGLRNQISTILRNPKKASQFSKAELALLREIREGTPIGNLIANISQAGWSLTGGRNVFGGGVAGATGLASAGLGFSLGGPMGAAIAALTEQSVTTGIKAVREMNLERRVELFRNIVASGVADQVKNANPAAYKMLESAFQAGQGALTRGGLGAMDQNIETMLR